MNYYEPMGFYTYKWDDVFFPVVYVREDGVLERQLELLRQAGWKIIELFCEKLLESSGSAEASVMVFEAIEFPEEIPDMPDDWIHEYLEDLHWLDLSQGFFFALKNYDALFQSPANILYGMEVSQEHLDQVLEFFEGRAIVIPDFDENDPGAEHPLYVKNKDEVLESWKYESK